MIRNKPKTYPLSATTFILWATHKTISPRIKGIIEHHAHHIAATKYQVHTVRQPSNDESWFESENMPSIVRLAQLVMSENSIAHIYTDLNLIGRVDQLYHYAGYYFLVDTKSHQEPTFRDQLQLSFYSFILELLGYKMAKVAFVRSALSNEITYQAVEVIPLQAMEEIIKEVD